MIGSNTGGDRVGSGRRQATHPHSGTTILLIGSAGTGGRFAVVETRERRGQEPPRHLHTREDEVVYVLEGRLTFYIGDEQLRATTGDCICLPRDVEHGFTIDSEGARLLVVLVPGGLEGYFREMDGHMGSEQYLERLIAVSAQYGVEITGPPPGME